MRDQPPVALQMDEKIERSKESEPEEVEVVEVVQMETSSSKLQRYISPYNQRK
jgi:hypothetical protein